MAYPITFNKKYYDQSKDSGVCVKHGCHNPSRPNRIYCEPCSDERNAAAKTKLKTNPEGRHEIQKRSRAKEGPYKRYFYMIKWKFGWTEQEYWELWKAQNEKCGNINCKEVTAKPSGGRMHLDHDEVLYKEGFKHESVRAILCHACNTFLGKMGENPARIAGLALLLEQHIQRREEILNKERLVV